MTSNPISRSILRYHGAKNRLAAKIISHFPVHTCYVEPFGGSAGVLLRKPPVQFEVYNDIDREVVTFFRMLREQPEALIRAIELTPYSFHELELAYEPTEDPLELARRFYVRSWQQHHPGRPHMNTGWRRQMRPNRGKSAIEDWNTTGQLWEAVERLKHVQIECRDAAAVIRSYDTPETLHYCDPPYLASTRSARWRGKGYRHEFDGPEDHQELHEVLQAVEGMVVLSGYRSRLYDDLYAGWQRIDLKGLDARAQTTEECLWISPSARDRWGPLFRSLA